MNDAEERTIPSMKLSDRKLAEGILYTDLYQLTMAQLYFRTDMHEKHALFEHFFRSYPNYGVHKAGYCVSAGLEWLVDWMQSARFGPEEAAYLRSLKGRTGVRIFQDDFIRWMEKYGNFDGISLYSIPEGRVVHPNIPMNILEGPIIMAQILETALLNKINFQTLIATKAARLREVGQGSLMLEFGIRRAQDLAAIAGTRAALIGGADFSSNVGISAVLGYPPKGTHAHSMIQLFMAMGEGELGAFRAYADIYPDDCLLLVDTINTLESGVPNAIKVFDELRRKGHEPVGIRLDSGDLAFLSIHAARQLNQAGYPNVKIVLSNNLDELVIWQIITQIRDEAPRYGVDPNDLISRMTYGVGTRLITSDGDAALDGVYKLVSVKNGEEWLPAIKISETPDKTLNPGKKRGWRLYDCRGKATADLIALEHENPRLMDCITCQHPDDPHKNRRLCRDEIPEIEPLHVTIMSEGKLVYDLPGIEDMRKQRQMDIDRLDVGVKRLVNPHKYHVSVTQELWDLKQEAIKA
ncbi:MAG: nicotinate phosphoribosyltransferase, partial [Anaerolineaceae bacterium]